jgi:two-component sensor histidine kinase
MQRSGRLEALGSLTSGVAHDFNNLLTVLVGNLALMVEDLREQPKVLGKLKAARDAAKRGADLVSQLLSFARTQSVESDLVEPASIVENIVPLIDRALGVGIALTVRIDPQRRAVMGNSAQLESVIVNLAVNARDALPSGGEVNISVSNVDLDLQSLPLPELSPGPYVEICVADNGSGIPQEVVDRVFEPFFSTKGDQGGTGLGLSMVRAFARQFGGAAEIESTVGEGTLVRLLLPMNEAQAEHSASMTMPLSALPSGNERVLILAGDDSLGSMMSQILEVLGYAVSVEHSLARANELLLEGKADLLIVDGFDAEALLAAQKMRNGGSAELVAIQLSTDERRGDRSARFGLRTLKKPFTLPELAAAVRECLDQLGR